MSIQLEQILNKMLMVNVRERYQSVDKILPEITNCSTDTDIIVAKIGKAVFLS